MELSKNTGQRIDSMAVSKERTGGIDSVKAVLLLLFFILLNIINFVDRQLIAAFGPAVVKDLNLSDTEFGLVNGIVFTLLYAVMGLFMGALADRFNRPRVIAAGLFLWSLLTAASGAARNFIHLASARVFIGVGESSLTPACMSMVADMFKPAKRGVASGAYYMGIPIGGGAAFVVAGLIGAKLGWRNTFYLMGAIGMTLTLILLFVKDPQRGRFDQTAVKKAVKAAKPSFREISSNVKRALAESPALVCIILGAVALHVPLGNMAFEQLWLVRERGMDAAKVAMTFGAFFMVSGLLGNFIGGAGGDWMNRKKSCGRIRFLAWMLLILTPIVLAYRFVAAGSPLFYCGMFCIGLYYMSFYGPVFATIQELVPVEIRSTIVGFTLLAVNVIGIGLGVALSGLLTDLLRDAGVAEPTTWMMLVSGCLGASSILFFAISTRYYENDMARLKELIQAG